MQVTITKTVTTQVEIPDMVLNFLRKTKVACLEMKAIVDVYNTDGGALTSIAAHLHVEAIKLIRVYAGDLSDAEQVWQSL